MSAWFMSKLNVDLIVQGAIQMELRCFLPPWNEPQVITRENADAFGRMLWQENARSVAARYPNAADEHRDNEDAARAYVFEPRQPPQADPRFPARVHGVALLKLVQCLAYQSCDDHQQSNAALAINTMAGRLLTAGHLSGGTGPGTPWDRAPWGVTPNTLGKCFAREWSEAA
jgi:hypothetical protein